ncbi:MAG: MoxR family ATPase [Thermoplasmata archaeon]
MKANNYGKKFKAIKSEIGRVVVGYEEVVDDFLVCLMTGGHLLLEGVPGIAKTTLIKEFTKVIGMDYKRIQFTQDMLPADITGHYFYDSKSGKFELRKGPVFTHVLMADEINRAPPKTQSALIEAMQERQVTIEGNTIHLNDPFFVVATRNPIETEGVYPLPEAQLDRFMIKSDMRYLSPEAELDLLELKNKDDGKKVRSMGGALRDNLYGLHRTVYVSSDILKYIRDIVLETRMVEELSLGASPRAAEQLLYASKAYALLKGRRYVIPDDVKNICKKVVPHRLILTVDAELENVSKLEVLTNILEEKVEAPKGKFKS